MLSFRPVRLLCAAAGLSLLQGCHAAMPTPAPITPPTSPVVTSGELAPTGDPVKAAQMNVRPVAWPLRFKAFNFGVRCYDTLECRVPFGRLVLGNAKPTKSSDDYGPDYLKGWNGGYLGVENFPPPVEVAWRTKDGVEHQAEIDIGELFKDEVVLHHVPREEVADLPDGEYGGDPSILFEVNGRTIRVYMKANVYTKHLQIPGNQYSSVRRDLILVKTYTF